MPNLSKWRRKHTGDLTQAFNFGAPADPSVPALPTPSRADTRVLLSDCPTQSPDVEKTKPILYGTVLVLLLLTFTLNFTAIMIRAQIRKRLRSER